MGQTINNGDTGLVARAKINEQLTRYFNVETYGAVHNLQTVTDGAMTSGSAVLTSASNLFVSGDVGKVIIVSRAGAANAPLRTTIASYQSAGQVTLAAAAGSTVSSQMIDWGTDDTPGIQAAINAAFADKAGVVFFPSGYYMINGNLQTSVSGVNPNSQLYIPPTSDPLIDNNARSLRLVGENAIARTNFRASLQGIGVVLKSTRLGSGTFPAILGGKGNTTNNPQSYTYCDVQMENITVWAYTNNGTSAPSMTGINFLKVHSIPYFKNVKADIDVKLDISSDAGASEVAGIIVGSIDDTTPNYMVGCGVSGYKYGMIVGEHMVLQNCFAVGNTHGFVIPTQNYMVVGHVLTHHCNNQFLFPNSSIMGLTHNTAKRGRVNLTLEVEYDTLTKWTDTETFIEDVGNRAYGEIRFMWLHGGVNIPYEGLGLISGGLNLQAVPSDGYTTLSANLAANTDNYTHSVIAGVNKIIFTPSASIDLTGINAVRMVEGRELTIRNASATNTITIKNDVTSTAANRFLMNADFALLPNMSVKFTYDITAARWIKL